MRHDEHYVEALAASAGAPIGRLVPIDQIDPNPDQPRQVMGDLSELIASIAEKGILEPLLVDRKSTRLNSSHVSISYAVFCLKKKKKQKQHHQPHTHASA